MGQGAGELPDFEQDRTADQTALVGWRWEADPMAQRGQGRVVVICGDTEEDFNIAVVDPTSTPKRSQKGRSFKHQERIKSLPLTRSTRRLSKSQQFVQQRA
jgi:hypothetical protein